MSEVVVRPARNVSGALRLPGDKSLCHRYAMLASIAEGRTRLHHFSSGADARSTLKAVEALGRPVRREGNTVEIEGGLLRRPDGPLDCGNSGSTMRMLSGILAAQTFVSELNGDASLSRRPMQRVIEPLERMGARIESAPGGRPPLRIKGAPLRGSEYRMPVASAQVKTCVLFAGLLAEGETWVEEPQPTRDHGELALRAFGADVQRERLRAGVRGRQSLRAIEATIPGDISSAAFYLCAAALFPGSNLVIDDVLLNPTRAAILDVLAAMGARTAFLNVEERHGELVGSLNLQPRGRLRGTSVFGALTAALIDELPVLAAIAPYTDGGIEIRDAGELRVKESDRIRAIAENLRALGGEVEEMEDGLRIPGGQALSGGTVDSAGDHRIAMAFAVAALRASGEVVIRGAEAADVSLPGFFQTLESLVER